MQIRVRDCVCVPMPGQPIPDDACRAETCLPVHLGPIHNFLPAEIWGLGWH